MRLFRRLAYLFRKSRNDAELAEEIALHRQLAEQEHLRDGLTIDDAHFAAQRQMGNVTRALENVRQVWIATWLESVLQDVRYAIRNLLRQPGFTVPALLTLALGIGLNTSLFTVFNGVALRPWPVRDPVACREPVQAMAWAADRLWRLFRIRVPVSPRAHPDPKRRHHDAKRARPARQPTRTASRKLRIRNRQLLQRAGS